MSDISLSQTVSISKLPRDYLGLLRRSADRDEPVVLLRHGKTIGAIVARKVLEKLLALKRRYEEEKILRIAEEGMREYRAGKAKTLKSLVELMD